MAQSRTSAAVFGTGEENTDAVTLGAAINFFIPRAVLRSSAPAWPPDVFAVCAYLLHETGSYCHVLTNWTPPQYRDSLGHWAASSGKVGQEWRESWVLSGKAPQIVNELWKK